MVYISIMDREESMEVTEDQIDTPASLQEHQNALLILLNEFDRVCKTLNIHYILFAGTMLGAVRHKGFIPWDDDLDVLMMRNDYERFLNEANAVLDQKKFFLQPEYSEHWPMFFSKLRINGTTCLEKYYPKDVKTHQGIYIDIFPCDNAAKTKLGRIIQFYSSKIIIAKCLWKRGYETDSFAKRVFMQMCRLLPMKPIAMLVKRGSVTSGYIHTFLAAASNYSKNVFPSRCMKNTVLATFEGAEYPISADYNLMLTTLYDNYMVLPQQQERKKKQHAVLVDLNNSYDKYRDYHLKIRFSTKTRGIR